MKVEFKLKYILTKGFYRFVWYLIMAKFGCVSIFKDASSGCYYSIGTFEVDKTLWDSLWRVRYIGKVFGEPLLEYSNDFNEPE